MYLFAQVNIIHPQYQFSYNNLKGKFKTLGP